MKPCLACFAKKLCLDLCREEEKTKWLYGPLCDKSILKMNLKIYVCLKHFWRKMSFSSPFLLFFCVESRGPFFWMTSFFVFAGSLFESALCRLLPKILGKKVMLSLSKPLWFFFSNRSLWRKPSNLRTWSPFHMDGCQHLEAATQTMALGCSSTAVQTRLMSHHVSFWGPGFRRWWGCGATAASASRSGGWDEGLQWRQIVIDCVANGVENCSRSGVRKGQPKQLNIEWIVLVHVQAGWSHTLLGQHSPKRPELFMFHVTCFVCPSEVCCRLGPERDFGQQSWPERTRNKSGERAWSYRGRLWVHRFQRNRRTPEDQWHLSPLTFLCRVQSHSALKQAS